MRLTVRSILCLAAAASVACAAPRRASDEPDFESVDSFESSADRGDGTKGNLEWSILRSLTRPRDVIFRGTDAGGRRQDIRFQDGGDRLWITAPGCAFQLLQGDRAIIDAENPDRCAGVLTELAEDLEAAQVVGSRADGFLFWATPDPTEAPECDLAGRGARYDAIRDCVSTALLPTLVSLLSRSRRVVGVVFAGSVGFLCQQRIRNLFDGLSYCGGDVAQLSVTTAIPASAQLAPVSVTVAVANALHSDREQVTLVATNEQGATVWTTRVDVTTDGERTVGATFTPPAFGTYTITATSPWMRPATTELVVPLSQR